MGNAGSPQTRQHNCSRNATATSKRKLDRIIARIDALNKIIARRRNKSYTQDKIIARNLFAFILVQGAHEGFANEGTIFRFYPYTRRNDCSTINKVLRKKQFIRARISSQAKARTDGFNTFCFYLVAVDTIKFLQMKSDVNMLRGGILDKIIAGAAPTILVSTTNNNEVTRIKKYFEMAGMLNHISRILYHLCVLVHSLASLHMLTHM